MQKWGVEELKDVCQEAVNALNRHKHLGLIFVDAWTFSNSLGSNLHIQYRDKSGKLFDICRNASILQGDKLLGVDVVANIPEKLSDNWMRVMLRIAYFIQFHYSNDPEAHK